MTIHEDPVDPKIAKMLVESVQLSLIGKPKKIEKSRITRGLISTQNLLSGFFFLSMVLIGRENVQKSSELYGKSLFTFPDASDETLELAVITQGIITAALQVDVMKLAVRQEQTKSATAFATEACATHNAT